MDKLGAQGPTIIDAKHPFEEYPIFFSCRRDEVTLIDLYHLVQFGLAFHELLYKCFRLGFDDEPAQISHAKSWSQIRPIDV